MTGFRYWTPRRIVWHSPCTVVLRRVILACLIALLIPSGGSSAAGSAPSGEDYLTALASALSEMESGNLIGANQFLTSAFALRRDEPLAYLTRGVLLLQCGAYAQAEGAFRDAAKLGGDSSLGASGLALSRLGLRDYAGASQALAGITAPEDADEAAIVRAYVALLSGQKVDLDRLDAQDPRVRLMKAFSALSAGKTPDPALLDVPWAEPSGPALDRGVTMGLDRSEPLMPVASSSEVRAITGPVRPGGTLAGTVRLRADAARTPEAALFLFYVGDRLLGVVNSPPFEISWDTTRFPNGVHRVTIRGQDLNGVVVGEVSSDVMVANLAPEVGRPLQGPAAERILRAIRESLRLRPNATWAQFRLGEMHQAAGRRSEAMLCYARILAFRPGYRDVQQRWRALARFTASAPVWKGNAGTQGIALTFDDGPNEGTPALLRQLERLSVRGTFFLVGSQARKRPDLVRAIAAAGHELACHSETHRSLAEMDREEIIRELFGPIAAVLEATGRVPRFFRPPGGHLSSEGRRVAAEFGLTPVMWSANCGPYEGGPVSGMEQYVASAASGSVVLMHNCEATTLEALPGIVQRLRSRGLSPGRLADVLR